MFVTKYRRNVVTKRAFDLLRRAMRKSCLDIGVDLVSTESDGDHVHVMIHYPPHLSLSTIVKRLKGASARFIRQHKLPEVLKKLWDKHFWSPSYFVVSCGGAPVETVKSYIENQQNPLRKKRTKTNLKLNRKISGLHPRNELRGFRPDRV